MFLSVKKQKKCLLNYYEFQHEKINENILKTKNTILGLINEKDRLVQLYYDLTLNKTRVRLLMFNRILSTEVQAFLASKKAYLQAKKASLKKIPRKLLAISFIKKFEDYSIHQTQLERKAIRARRSLNHLANYIEKTKSSFLSLTQRFYSLRQLVSNSFDHYDAIFQKFNFFTQETLNLVSTSNREIGRLSANLEENIGVIVDNKRTVKGFYKNEKNLFKSVKKYFASLEKTDPLLASDSILSKGVKFLDRYFNAPNRTSVEDEKEKAFVKEEMSFMHSLRKVRNYAKRKNNTTVLNSLDTVEKKLKGMLVLKYALKEVRKSKIDEMANVRKG